MCKCKRKGAQGVGAMPPMNEPDWGMLAATVAGAAGSNVVVNPIVSKLFASKTDEEKLTYAGYLKIGLGFAGVLFSPNEYLSAASLGILIDGGVDTLRAHVPQLKPALKGYGGGIGEVIDLSREDWRELNGIESDHSVGYAQEYAVSGGVN
jgi:hypothetical protein